MGVKRILLIGPYPPPEGGVSVHLQRLLQKSAQNHETELAVYDVRKGIFIDCNGNHSGIFSAVRFFLSSSIVHLHISHPLKVFIGRMVKVFGKKLFYTQHNSREENRSSTKSMIRLSDKVIYVYHDDRFPERLVIPAYIPSNDSTEITPEMQTLISGRRVVVTMGTVAKNQSAQADLYGFDLLLKSIESVSVDEPLLVIFIDVNGAFEDRYREVIEQIQERSGQRILLSYFTGGINFPALLKAADVYVRSTTTDGDSIAVREALNCGTRVVASDCVKRPEGCILFNTGDKEYLAVKIAEALKGGKMVYLQEDYSEQLFALYKSR